MRTTTHVFRFIAEPSQEALSAKVAEAKTRPRQILVDFFNLHGISDDNLVSETVDHETCLRTVVRNWPSLEIATAWTVAILDAGRILRDLNADGEFPGVVISSVVDPE